MRCREAPLGRRMKVVGRNGLVPQLLCVGLDAPAHEATHERRRPPQPGLGGRRPLEACIAGRRGFDHRPAAGPVSAQEVLAHQVAVACQRPGPAAATQLGVLAGPAAPLELGRAQLREERSPAVPARQPPASYPWTSVIGRAGSMSSAMRLKCGAQRARTTLMSIRWDCSCHARSTALRRRTQACLSDGSAPAAERSSAWEALRRRRRRPHI